MQVIWQESDIRAGLRVVDPKDGSKCIVGHVTGYATGNLLVALIMPHTGSVFLYPNRLAVVNIFNNSGWIPETDQPLVIIPTINTQGSRS